MPELTADLIVLGATPGGIAAAIAAARQSRTSLILERTPYIGGLPANGLGATDIATRGATGGIFLEFVDRIKAHYVAHYGSESDQVRDCDDGYHFEPSVAEEVFRKWLEEYPQIKILCKRQFDFEPENVLKSSDETRIIGIKILNLDTQESATAEGHFFLDCTYEGDLIAAAGVPFFVGREGREVYGEMGAGRVYKLWNGSECSGSTGVGDNAVQAYNYRLCITTVPENRAEIKRPAHYNREEYISLIEDVSSGRHTGVHPPISEDEAKRNIERSKEGLRPIPDKLGGIRRLLNSVVLPNGKVDANNQHNAFISTDLPEENWPYPTSSWAWRDRFAQRLREYTEGLLYFAQNDSELPAWFREECLEWGWAADEYVENGNFPRQIYVREGRRMRGKYIFTANDVVVTECLPSNQNGVSDGRQNLHRDSITASHYALDSHAVRKREPGRAHLDGFFSYRCQPYTVPYGVMVPDSSITNLLAPVPCSATHVGFSTLRMEPAWMALGQAAGTAASLCIANQVAASEVDVGNVQKILLDQGAVLVYDTQLWTQEVDDEQRKTLQTKWLKSST